MPRTRLTDEQRRAALLAEQAKIATRLRQMDAKAKAQARKDDTRRKIIAGALALEHKDAAFQATMEKLLNEYVTKPDERRLFGLEPLPDMPPPGTPDS